MDVTFESGGEPYPEGEQWRPITPYEASILGALLYVLGGDGPIIAPKVRTMDECGCIEFQPGDNLPGEPVVLAEASIPESHPLHPLDITLTGQGVRALWLEFHHYGFDRSRRPDPTDLIVVPR